MLKITNLYVSVGLGSSLARPVLQDLQLDIASGEFVIIIGDNGAGKSTLFNAISGYIPSHKGQIWLQEKDISQWPSYQRAPYIAKVLQNPREATMENMTLEENLSFALLRGQNRGLHSYQTSKRRDLFRHKLSQLGMGLEGRLHHLAGSLSGGQRQALSLIMATLSSSEVLLLDEITAALDPKTAELMMQLTRTIVAEEKRTTLMITHNMTHALSYGDRTLVLHQGKIIRSYNASERDKFTPADLGASLSNFDVH